jgi:hypothetical protein
VVQTLHSMWNIWDLLPYLLFWSNLPWSRIHINTSSYVPCWLNTSNFILNINWEITRRKRRNAIYNGETEKQG